MNGAAMLIPRGSSLQPVDPRETGGFTPGVRAGGASAPGIFGTTSGTSAPAPTPTEGGS